MNETVIVLDFGGQYNQLIARRVRENGVYCEVLSYKTSISELRGRNPKGIIFTGGPSSVNADNAPIVDAGLFALGIPVLGICYGAQVMACVLGGKISSGADSAPKSEFGRITAALDTGSALFTNLPKQNTVWMSHNDHVCDLPSGFVSIAHSDKCDNAAFADDGRKLYGVQFHPEVTHTDNGALMLKNFLLNICGCSADWSMDDYAEIAVANLRRQIGGGKVLLALSGGVDSSVAAALLAKAVGEQLTCIFVDHGLLRKNEGDEVEAVFGRSAVNFIRVNAEDRFLQKLANIEEPETKRKIIGNEFIEVFTEEARKIGSVDFLAQGTIYPDVIESGLGDSAVIKSHHNVGGLPDRLNFKALVEPLRILFKDEVRALGTRLGLPDTLVWRQPFPGPGLAIRIIGDITKEKLDTLREADAIFREEIAIAKISQDINQYFAVLTNVRSVGVMGDGRTYDFTVALRAVCTGDFMTADFARIPYDVLERVSARIVNEVRHINLVCYDITSKPPATIEWE